MYKYYSWPLLSNTLYLLCRLGVHRSELRVTIMYVCAYCFYFIITFYFISPAQYLSLSCQEQISNCNLNKISDSFSWKYISSINQNLHTRRNQVQWQKCMQVTVVIQFHNKWDLRMMTNLRLLMPVHLLSQLMGPQSGSHLCYPAMTNITQVPHYTDIHIGNIFILHLMFMAMMQHFSKLTYHSKKAKLQLMQNESNKWSMNTMRCETIGIQ